eukprot:1749468-Prymnesium_polylepis.1
MRYRSSCEPAALCDVANRILRTEQNYRGQNAHSILNCARVLGGRRQLERVPGGARLGHALSKRSPSSAKKALGGAFLISR